LDPVPEWERLRRFFHAETPPLALIEVESSAQADEVIEAVGREVAGEVSVYRFGPRSTPRDALGWLDGAKGMADGRSVFLLVATDLPPEAEAQTRTFWREMSFQRERWRAPAGRLAFVLTPSLVDCLARDADALWDWIPLKFNLLRPRRGEGLAQDQRLQMAADRPGRTPAEALRVLPVLREQLLNARRTGLAESVIRREYAWPLFRALRDAGHIRKATEVLRTDLSGDFASELAPRERIRWLFDLAYLHLDRWDLSAAESAFRQATGLAKGANDDDSLRAGYHGLGMVAQERRAFAEAERWYLKSLAITEKLGVEHPAASTYHQLGRVAQERRDFAEAERWYLKSLAIVEKRGDEHGAGITYHQLGMVAQERRDLAEAEKWYLKSLAIFEKQADEHGAAATYHQLGILAQERRDSWASSPACKANSSSRGGG
jgi:tetratricopeptide (TPR) repeat protein